MENKDCSCKEFEELRGASVNGYIAAFLDLDGNEKNRFVCKVCGTTWEKIKTDDATKPSLVKIRDPKN
jgi:rubrerythrin